MNKVVPQKNVPSNSIILKELGKVNYQDSYLIKTQTHDTVDNITTQIFSNGPKWTDVLMKLRDSIVKFFGLKTSPNANIASYYPIGSKAVLFKVIDRNDNEIVIGEEDKHLNFRTSVLRVEENGGTIVYLTTVVKFNNGFGKFYFAIIKPFHRLIIKSCLKRYAKSIR